MNEQTPADTKLTGLALMREPFPEHQISLLPKPYKKDSERGLCAVCGTYHGLPALHLDYVGHAAITLRLLDADPGWQWEPMAFGTDGLPQYDRSGGLWIRLTVAGVTRLGYGNAAPKERQEVGAREKEVIGDALRNAAMRFGAALDLWHKGDLHGNGDDGDDDDDTRKARTAAAEGNANGAAPPDQRRPASPPPARKSAAPPPARAAASKAGAPPEGISEGQMKNLLVKIKSLGMDADMLAAMLARLDVRAIDTQMTLADWKLVKAELDAAARLV